MVVAHFPNLKNIYYLHLLSFKTEEETMRTQAQTHPLKWDLVCNSAQSISVFLSDFIYTVKCIKQLNPVCLLTIASAVPQWCRQKFHFIGFCEKGDIQWLCTASTREPFRHKGGVTSIKSRFQTKMLNVKLTSINSTKISLTFDFICT